MRREGTYKTKGEYLVFLRHNVTSEHLIAGRNRLKTPIWECRMGHDYITARSGQVRLKKYIGNQVTSRKSGRVGKRKKYKNKQSNHSNQCGKLKKNVYQSNKHFNWVRREYHPELSFKQLSTPGQDGCSCPGYGMSNFIIEHNNKATKCGFKLISK